MILCAGAPTRVNQIGENGPMMYEVWNTQQTPASIDSASGEPAEERLQLAPPPNGSRIRVLEVPPDSEQLRTMDGDAVQAHFAIMNAASASTQKHGAAHPLMHRTESIDYGIVLDGEITLILDNESVALTAGDIVVQRGTNHAWSNHSTRPCRIAFVLIDGKFADGLADAIDRRETVA